jgi:ABC-2 type transport system permease protein
MSVFHKKSESAAPKTEKGSLKVSLAAASRKHSSQKGAFSAVLTALAVVAVIVFNLLIAQLPDSATQYDMTSSQIYNITQTSQKYLKKMKSNVQIHVLADKKSVDTRIVRFLQKYVSLSDHLSVEYINPTTYPSVLSKYGCDANTIVVTCKATGRQETVSLSNIIGYDQMSYYTSGSATETSFDAEGLLTSAVDGVLTTTTYKVYQTTGHGETALPTAVETQLKKAHMTVGSVNLLSSNGIPKDCDLLILDAPAKDLANDELTVLQNYLSAGGKVIYCMAGQNLSLPNFEKLCASYGMSVASGMIADTQRCYQNNPYWFFPTADSSVDAASSLSSNPTILCCGSRGFTVSKPTESGVTVSPFLTTSKGSYAVVDNNTKTEGTYVVGAVATKAVDDNLTARFTVYGSDSLINSDILESFPSIDNLSLFTSSATVGFGNVSSLNIQPVSLKAPTNTITTGGIWAILFIFVIPAATLIFGFVRWMRRRKL